jgi:hypothetical protein
MMSVILVFAPCGSDRSPINAKKVKIPTNANKTINELVSTDLLI